MNTSNMLNIYIYIYSFRIEETFCTKTCYGGKTKKAREGHATSVFTQVIPWS